MYSGDLADAVIRAISQFDSLPHFMNVGLGCDYTINDYYKTVAEVMNYQGAFIHDLTKPVGMSRKLVDIHRQKVWGFQPRISLREGVTQTYHYYLKEQINEL
jgi:GDP-L-fucose synthase